MKKLPLVAVLLASLALSAPASAGGMGGCDDPATDEIEEDCAAAALNFNVLFVVDSAKRGITSGTLYFSPVQVEDGEIAPSMFKVEAGFVQGQVCGYGLLSYLLDDAFDDTAVRQLVDEHTGTIGVINVNVAIRNGSRTSGANCEYNL